MVLQKPEDAPQDVPTPPVGSVVVPPPEEPDADIAAIEATEEPAAEPKLTLPDFQPKPPSHELGDTMRNILLAVSGVFLLLAMCSAWLLWQNIRDDDTDKKPATAQTTPTIKAPTTATITCADDLTIYKNQDLGFGFCYPAIWGAITVADGTLASGDTGKRWKVTFADKDPVEVDLLTKDWTTTKTNDAACQPTNATVPPFTITTAWAEQKTGAAVVSANRGIEASDGTYVIQEFAESQTLKGACLQGYTLLTDSDFDHTIATYMAGFTSVIQTVEQHESSPTTLIPTADRDYLTALTKSVQAL